MSGGRVAGGSCGIEVDFGTLDALLATVDDAVEG
jgi:hypothetical protein